MTKIGGKVAHEPQKNPLDFGDNPDHHTLGSGYTVSVMADVTFHTRQDCNTVRRAPSRTAILGVFY